MKTAITEMFGIEYPIICGAMMWLCKPQLCAAISNAGGMGNLTAGNYESEEEFRGAIRETRKLTDKPFMVNVSILPSVHISTAHHKMYLKVCADEKIAGVEISGIAHRQGLRSGVCRYAQEGEREDVSQGRIDTARETRRKGRL